MPSTFCEAELGEGGKHRNRMFYRRGLATPDGKTVVLIVANKAKN